MYCFFRKRIQIDLSGKNLRQQNMLKEQFNWKKSKNCFWYLIFLWQTNSQRSADNRLYDMSLKKNNSSCCDCVWDKKNSWKKYFSIVMGNVNLGFMLVIYRAECIEVRKELSYIFATISDTNNQFCWCILASSIDSRLFRHKRTRRKKVSNLN